VCLVTCEHLHDAVRVVHLALFAGQWRVLAAGTATNQRLDCLVQLANGRLLVSQVSQSQLPTQQFYLYIGGKGRKPLNKNVPLFDDICKRSLKFIQSCMTSDNRSQGQDYKPLGFFRFKKRIFMFISTGMSKSRLQKFSFQSLKPVHNWLHIMAPVCTLCQKVVSKSLVFNLLNVICFYCYG